MSKKTLTGYIKGLSDSELKELAESQLFADLKLPDLMKKLKAEIEERDRAAHTKNLPSLFENNQNTTWQTT